MVERAPGVTLGKVEDWSRLVRTLAINVSKDQLRAILLPNGVPTAVPTAWGTSSISAWGALSVLAEMLDVLPEGAETEAHRPGKPEAGGRRPGEAGRVSAG